MGSKTIRTFVFLDLETTGLPKEELNKTRITELSMVAVKREHILDAVTGRSPRVVHKLTMCFNPGKMIDPLTTKITGLCNDVLESESNFNVEVFKAIDSYLGVFAEPICLIAHNGNNFDFPILQNRLERLRMRFTKEIMCADSYFCFYDIENASVMTCNQAGIQGYLNDEAKPEIDLNYVVQENDDVSLNQGNQTQECDKNIPKDIGTFINTAVEQKLMKKVNELTPRKSNKRKADEEPAIIRSSKVRKGFPWGKGPKPKVSYRLGNIYARVNVDHEIIRAHRAENDSIKLMLTARRFNDKFVKWVDSNCSPFAEFPPMALGVPII